MTSFQAFACITSVIVLLSQVRCFQRSVFVTFHGKTYTNALPLNGIERLLTVQLLFKRFKKSLKALKKPLEFFSSRSKRLKNRLKCFHKSLDALEKSFKAFSQVV